MACEEGSIAIPQEMIIHILYHLPTKSVGRFRSVSKEWLSLLSGPGFIKTHEKTLNRTHLIFLLNYKSLYSLPFHNHEGVSTLTKLPFESPIYLRGSCNGLVLVSADDDETLSLYIINPTTKDSVLLADNPVCLGYKHHYSVYGFGYDYATDDYKAAAQVERWAMPTWCHMFNSTLIGAARVWFDELLPESIDGYKDMKAAFPSYFMQQKKYVKDPVEIHNIKQREGETLKDFIERFKIETGQLIKHLNEHVPKTMEEMMIATTAFIRGETTAASKKKGHGSWKPQDQPKKHADKRRDFRGHSRDEGPLVIEAEMGGHTIHHMYIDGGSSIEILYEHCFNRFQPKIKSQMVPATTSLTRFSGETTWPLGQLRLLVTVGDNTHSTKAWMNFMIVKSLSPYNGIIGRPGLKAIQAVPSTVHGMLKFPTKEGIVTIRSSLLIPAECTSIETSSPIPREKETRPTNLTVPLHLNFPDQEVVVGGSLSDKGRTELCALLKKNLDIFAWQPSDMTGVPRSIAEHRLNIWEGCPPVRQKKKGQAPDRTKAIQVEVQKFVEARIMREVYYHDWLSNPVMVKKHDGSWRMCVDFTDLNKAYAYKGYHQIQMAAADEEKTAFHTGQGVYCYTKMPFGLKNASATYQRLMDKVFESQMGQNIEVYVDDLVVKSHTEAKMVRDIEETFQTLRKINMKLNLKKCSFWLVEGVFLGYVITPEGIKPCSDKTTAVLQLPSPQTIKEVQSLNGKLASLNSPDDRTGDSPDASLLYKPCVTGSGTKLLTDGKTLVFAAKRLRRYFQAHPITVITNQPIKQVMSRLDVVGRLQKWSIMLGEHNITYRLRTSIKGQILADFLNEMLSNASHGVPVAETQEEPWTLFTDGSSYVDGSGAGLILTNPDGVEFTYALRFQFAASNNEAEYEALIASLRIAMQMGVKNIQANVDSKLLANQVLGTYVAKEDNMIKYLDIAKGLVSGFKTFSISQVPRSKNKKADALSKIASTSFAHLSKQVLVEVLETKSITGKEVTSVIEEEGPTWITELVNYLKEGTLPEDEKEARRLRLKARQYELMEGILYKRSFLTPWLRCMGPLQAEYVMKEIHEGSCSMHAGPRSGIDIAGPFLKGPGKVKFLIVAMDYFTKWIEAKVVATITDGQVKKFVWDNIVCRFGIPGEIISENGKQFADNPFKHWCDKLNITQHFASVKHPQSNGLVERANRSLGEGIKARLGEGNKNWVEELPHILWTHRTMIKSSHGDTPFSLTYGTEAVIPAEIGMPTYRTTAVDTVNNDEELRLNLDLLEERRKLAAMSEARSKSKTMKYYNSRVRGVAFKPGDFVYHSNDASHAVAGGKLGPK
nr:reverse transcriptase domain-containing protein [Tanacetum cinerariifolium]